MILRSNQVPRKRKRRGSGIWFSGTVNEQTVCEADRGVRKHEFASLRETK